MDLEIFNNALHTGYLKAASDIVSSNTGFINIGTQTIPPMTVEQNQPVPVDTVFRGIGTTIEVKLNNLTADASNYTIINGLLRFLKPGNFSVEITNIPLTSVGDPATVKYPSIVALNKYVTAVSLDRHDITVAVNTGAQLAATVSPADADIKNVSWSSANTAIAAVSQAGLVSGVSAGSTMIFVTTADGGIKDSCLVTVYVPVTGISLNKKSSTLTINSTEQLTATILPAGATDKTLSWSSSNTAVATVSPTGLVTALSTGTTEITVYAGGRGNNDPDTCVITVYYFSPDDAAALRTFLSLNSADGSQKNAEKAGLTASDMQNWTESQAWILNVTGLTWNNENTRRLTGINWNSRGLAGRLNLTGCDKIETMDISGNKITDINLASQPDIKELLCGSNSLTRLSLAANLNLERLSCENNPAMTSVNFGNNQRLAHFNCLNNSKLTSIVLLSAVPPALSTYSSSPALFTDCHLFVPNAAINTYKQADFWKNFQLIQSSEAVAALKVNLNTDANANVFIYPYGVYDEAFSATWNEQAAAYICDELPLGRFYVKADADGYFAQWYGDDDVKDLWMNADEVNINQAGKTHEISMELTAFPEYTETGRVTVEGNIYNINKQTHTKAKVARNAVIIVYKKKSKKIDLDVWELYITAQADESGYYRFTNLPAGDYLIVADRAGYKFEGTGNGEGIEITAAEGSTYTNVDFYINDDMTITAEYITAAVETFHETSLQIYPNTFKDQITVRGGIVGSRYTISNIAGKTLKTGILSSNIERIDLSDLPAGTYLLWLDKFKTVKIIHNK
jgi:uncharacterized protein YjdB